MNIKQLKQDKADLAAKLAKVKAEGWKLGAVPVATRTEDQVKALAKVDADIAELPAFGLQPCEFRREIGLVLLQLLDVHVCSQMRSGNDGKQKAASAGPEAKTYASGQALAALGVAM